MSDRCPWATCFRFIVDPVHEGFNRVPLKSLISKILAKISLISKNQRAIGPENAHLKPDPGVLSHHEMTLTLNTHTPLLNS